MLGDTTYGQLSIFNEVVRIVLEAYVEPVNLDRAMAGARLGLTEALDGDSAYLDAEEFRAYQAGGQEDGRRGGRHALPALRRSSWWCPPARLARARRPGVTPGDLLKSIDGRHTRPLSAAWPASACCAAPRLRGEADPAARGQRSRSSSRWCASA